MERQSTSKLYRALIAVVAFFVLCTSAILFASCGTDPKDCKHDNCKDGDVVAVELASCNTPGTVTYKCPDCGAPVTVIGTLATGEHKWANGVCSVCGIAEGSQGLSLKEVKDLLAKVATQEGLDEARQKIVEALTDDDCTLPTLDAKLESILDSVRGLGDLEIDLSDVSTSFLADVIAEGDKVSLATVITELYKQVHQLYVDYASTSTSAATLYKLLVGTTNGAHVHNWVLKIVDKDKGCNDVQNYKWTCAFCGEEKPGAQNVVVQAIGHVTDFKYALTYTGADKDLHYKAATCISGERVEGHCVNCGQWTGEWTTIGSGTGKHHYVLENGTDANGNAGSKGSCTSVHQNVYHCVTCGGAYVEEVQAPGHQYFYKLDANGAKEALSDAEKKQIVKDYWGVDDAKYEALTDTQKEEALNPYLNVVYSAEATCVDPGLVVVECVECGVRYSYTTGEGPKGHSLVAGKQLDSTCTSDGIAGYAYCYQCGYFFFFDAKLDDKCFTQPGTCNSVTGSGSWYESNDYPATAENVAFANAIGGWYSRNYIRKDGKVLHYDVPETVATPEQYLPKAEAQNDEGKVDSTLAALYDVTSSVLPAKGHDYVPVYTNTVNCVTAQTYILVCKACFGEYDEDGAIVKETDDETAHDFDFYTVHHTHASSTAEWETATEDEGKSGALFDAWTTGTGDNATTTYSLACLTSKNNVTDQADAEEAVETIVEMMLADDHVKEEPEEGHEGDDPVYKTSDLTEDWNEIAGTGKNPTPNDLVEWLGDHGYLNRDPGDDVSETYWLGLSVEELKALYNPWNVVVTATTSGTNTTYTATTFANPVSGHTFTDKIVTIVGGCTMYERHVTFCSVCGTNVLTDGRSDGKGPATVTGVADGKLAGYSTVPADFKTDLQKEWDEIVEAGDGNAAFGWLADHGYLNDYITDELEMFGDQNTGIMLNLGLHLYGSDPDAWQKFYNEPIFDIEDVVPFFTGENVLGEFTVDSKVALDEETYSFSLEKLPLGHKFDAVAYIGVGETCDAPASYVYVCSVCGGTLNSDEFSFTKASETVTVETLKKIDEPTYVADDTVFATSVMPDRQGTGTGKIAKSDLAADWDAATDKFTWLLEKGYLNGVIDSVMLFGYEKADRTHVDGELEKVLKDPTGSEATLKENFKSVYGKFYTVTPKVPAVEADPDNLIPGSPEIPAFRTFNATEENIALIRTAATDLALKGGYGTGTTPDFTKFYLQSGDTVVAEDDGLTEAQAAAINGHSANKTSSVAATTIPESGHLWADGKGNPINPLTAPLCKDFASAELKAIFAQHKYPVWTAGKNGKPGSWSASAATDASFDSVVNSVEADKNGTALQQFLYNVENYGIVAACTRGDNCPLHTTNVNAVTAQYAFGFYAATDHVESYEKFDENKKTGFPTPQVEVVDGQHTYYNMNPDSYYATADIAGKKLAGYSATLNNQETLWNAVLADRTSGTESVKLAAEKKYQDAVDAARRDDIYNLRTLQEIWNTLFVDLGWLYPTNSDGIIWGTVSDLGTAQSRMARYPFYNVAGYVTTDTVTVTEGSTTTTYTKITGHDFIKIKALFDATVGSKKGEIPYLWKGADPADGSAWRPLNDKGEPSCWVDLRCKWFHASADGTKCTSGNPQNQHTMPKTDRDDYNYQSYVANCQHIDLCTTCGLPYGGVGKHNTVVKLAKTEPDARYQQALLAIIWASQAKTITASDSKDATDILANVKSIVKVTATTWEELSWTSGWDILEPTCKDGKVGTASFCSGELEVIAKNLADPTKGITKWNDSITFAKTGDGKNCDFVAGDEQPHSWDDPTTPTYKRVYYYLGTFTLLATGDQIGEKDGEIYVNTKTKQIVAAGTDGAEVLTNKVIEEDLGGINPLDFSEVVCTTGYYTRDFCVNHGRGGETDICDKVDPDTDGYTGKIGTTDHTGVQAYRHEPKGHFFSPVENYWEVTGGVQGYKNWATDTENTTKNSWVAQVCTTCGLNHQGYYGDVTEDGKGDGRVQFKISSNGQIDAWNKYIDETGSTFKKAQTIRPDDVREGNESVDSAYAFTTGQEVYKDDATLKLGGASDTTVTTVVGEGVDATLLVASGKTLTFDTAKADATEASIQIKGTLSIVGELDAEGKPTSTVDFSKLKRVATDGGNLILKNINVKLGGCWFNPGMKVGDKANGGAIEMSHVYVEATGAVFSMNAATASDGDNVITIDNSTLVSTGGTDFALTVWKKNVTVNATKSTFFGAKGGALIRGGTANFTECTFLTTAEGAKEGESHTWTADGSNVTVNGALVVGNGSSAADYGNAVVTLSACEFGTTTYTAAAAAQKVGSLGEIAELTTGQVAIDATSSNVNETKITITDAATLLNMGGGKVVLHAGEKNYAEEGKPADVRSSLTYTIPEIDKTDLGEDADEQLESAIQLAENVLASGGSITLPKLDKVTSGDSTKDAEIALDKTAFDAADSEVPTVVDFGGNKVKVTAEDEKGVVKGDVTLKNATITVDGPTDSSKSALAVQGTADKKAALTLDNVVLTSDSPIYAMSYGVLTINKSLVRTSNEDGSTGTGYCVTTNGNEDHAEIVVTDSTLISGYWGNTALLLNAANDKLTAKGSTFYGTCTGVWVRAGVASFEDCTFITGSVTITGEDSDWGNGLTNPNSAKAALLVGNGGTSNYGNADVTIKGNCKTECVIEGSEAEAPHTPKKETSPKVTFGNTLATAIDINSAKPDADDEDHKVGKPFVFASGESDSTTTVTFENEAKAKAFVGEKGLVKNENVYYAESGSKITVQYITKADDPATEGDQAEYAPVYVNFTPDKDNVDGAITDVTKNGGKIILPDDAENGKITLESAVAVDEGRKVEIDLNGKELELSSNAITAKKDADLTITNGKISTSADQPIVKVGAGNVTLSGVTYEGNAGCALTFAPETANTAVDVKDKAVWTIQNSVIIANGSAGTALWVNGLVDGAVLNITDSVLIGSETGLEVAGDVTVNAKNSAFYGKSAAVQLNSGSSTFDACTFIGEGQNCDNTWSNGNSYPEKLNAIFVVISKTGYGANVKVELKNNCTFVVSDSTTGLKDKAEASASAKEIVGGNTKSGKYYGVAANTTIEQTHLISLAVVGDGQFINFKTDKAYCSLEAGTNVFKYSQKVAGTEPSTTDKAKQLSGYITVDGPTGYGLTDPVDAEQP